MSRFFIFLALFLSIYGSAHLYVLIKARRALYPGHLPYLFTVVVLVFLMIAPIQARFLEANNYPVLSVIMSWIGYVWMGGLFIFICLSLPLDIYHLGLAAIQYISQMDLTRFMLSRRQRFGFAVLAALVLTAYGAFEAHRVKPETITLKSAKIPPAVKRIRIVQISDLHIGAMTFPARINSVIAAVKAAEPDLLVSTGDLVDGRTLFHQKTTADLAGTTAPLGKFAVTGNHEVYAGIDAAMEFTRMAGFTPLRNEHIRIKNTLVIAGVDDPARGAVEAPEKKVLENLPNDSFILLLKHRPVVAPESLDRFDLQLSGHIHKGQIFPFNLLVDMFYRWQAGTHQVSTRSRIHISRGSGTWGPPLRLLAPPEITIIDLLPDQPL